MDPSCKIVLRFMQHLVFIRGVIQLITLFEVVSFRLSKCLIEGFTLPLKIILGKKARLLRHLARFEGVDLLHLVKVVSLNLRQLDHCLILHFHNFCVIFFVPDHCLVLLDQVIKTLYLHRGCMVFDFLIAVKDVHLIKFVLKVALSFTAVFTYR